MTDARSAWGYTIASLRGDCTSKVEAFGVPLLADQTGFRMRNNRGVGIMVGPPTPNEAVNMLGYWDGLTRYGAAGVITAGRRPTRTVSRAPRVACNRRGRLRAALGASIFTATGPATIVGQSTPAARSPSAATRRVTRSCPVALPKAGRVQVPPHDDQRRLRHRRDEPAVAGQRAVVLRLRRLRHDRRRHDQGRGARGSWWTASEAARHRGGDAAPAPTPAEPASQPMFIGTPIFGSSGQALVGFSGGTVDRCRRQRRPRGASDVGVQDASGGFKLLVGAGSSFINDAFCTTCAGGLAANTPLPRQR